MSRNISNVLLIVSIVCVKNAYCCNIPDSSLPKYILSGLPKTPFRMFLYFKHEIKLKKRFILTRDL